MKATGIVRRIADLGRIVIPKEIRKEIFGSCEEAEGRPMEFYIDDGKIIIVPYKCDNIAEIC